MATIFDRLCTTAGRRRSLGHAEGGGEIRLIHQIHDELILEVRHPSSHTSLIRYPKLSTDLYTGSGGGSPDGRTNRPPRAGGGGATGGGRAGAGKAPFRPSRLCYSSWVMSRCTLNPYRFHVHDYYELLLQLVE